ncbi:MAG: hypothetical protein GF383_04890, partial [Candidatus Lokiarchaeota archaeon]|nr:hypothetical protein [Candidatus Lokiarchaeota archaeon]MBD3339163.1 hypothetical protein [Candidatus Lokiarchaeota archaeon]
MVLTLEENLQGIFSVIFSTITLIIALIIALKYLKFKKIELILVGIAFIGLAAPWIAVAVKFILIVTINSTLSEELFFIINLGIVPFTAFCWIMAMTNLMNVRKKIRFYLYFIWIVFALIFEIIFLFTIFTDTTLIGKFTGTLQVEF